ncbi:hypothetical protein FXO38_05532 [Capsicum annuum]|nr:hypothetical protein FXO37_12861 [Capsicum annuum]KAF3673701.1 hypothetical protein FXO38_05532 [Capsicum annuum]
MLSNVQQAELLAILKGLRLGLDRQLTPLEINSDSSVAINMISSNHLGYCNIMSECRYLLQRLGTPMLKHTCREQNSVADVLAGTGTIGDASFDQLQILPFPTLCAAQALAAGKQGNAFPQGLQLIMY